MECKIAFDIQGLSKRFLCRFDSLRKGAWRSLIVRRLSTIVDILSLTSFDTKVLKSTASKPWWKASLLKCLKSRKNLQSATKLLTHSPFWPLFRHCDPFFALLAWPFNPPHPRTMLCGNCCDLELQTNNIEWGSGVLFHRLLCGKKIVLVGALEVLSKDNVSTNYVTDCRFIICRLGSVLVIVKAKSRFN